MNLQSYNNEDLTEEICIRGAYVDYFSTTTTAPTISPQLPPTRSSAEMTESQLSERSSWQQYVPGQVANGRARVCPSRPVYQYFIQ